MKDLLGRWLFKKVALLVEEMLGKVSFDWCLELWEFKVLNLGTDRKFFLVLRIISLKEIVGSRGVGFSTIMFRVPFL